MKSIGAEKASQVDEKECVAVLKSTKLLQCAIHEEEGEEKLNLLMVDSRIPAGAKLY